MLIQVLPDKSKGTHDISLGRDPGNMQSFGDLLVAEPFQAVKPEHLLQLGG